MLAAPLDIEPNWLMTTVVGAVLGAIFGAMMVPLGRLASYPVRRLKPHPLNGRWYSYHLTFVAGKLQLRFGTIRIRPGIRTRYAATRVNSAVPPDDCEKPAPVLRYRGRVLPGEADHVVIIFRGTTHHETVVYRFLNRIPSNAGVIPGVWMAYDHDLRPAAGSAILSQTLLPADQALRVLHSWLVCEQGALHLRTSPEGALDDGEPPDDERTGEDEISL